MTWQPFHEEVKREGRDDEMRVEEVKREGRWDESRGGEEGGKRRWDESRGGDTAEEGLREDESRGVSWFMLLWSSCLTMILKSVRGADGIRNHKTSEQGGREKRGRGKASLTGSEHECLKKCLKAENRARSHWRFDTMKADTYTESCSLEMEAHRKPDALHYRRIIQYLASDDNLKIALCSVGDVLSLFPREDVSLRFIQCVGEQRAEGRTYFCRQPGSY